MSADVDLVMMSKATNEPLRDMTQLAIDTAIRHGVPYKVNPIVLEQTSVEYDNAFNVHMPGPFNYNQFCNVGAKLGKAPWIMFCNNDLSFAKGYLKALLEPNHPVVSPISPGYHRQLNLLGNEVGHEVGRHLAGWCFLMSRWLWDALGGLDETYPFWCADNAVMDQLRDKGIQPMAVRGAVVHHLVSATLTREDRDVQDALTWEGLHRFNSGRPPQERRLLGDRRYMAWKRRQGIR